MVCAASFPMSECVNLMKVLDLEMRAEGSFVFVGI